jgi:uncharacterized protein (TIGR03382 family)
MRRLPALLLVAGAPFAALAQNQITAAVATMNSAQCTGTTNDVRKTDDLMTVGLTWTTTLVNPSASPAFAGTTYRLFAGNQAFTTDATKGELCTVTTGDTSTFTSGQVGGDFLSTQQNITAPRGYNLKEIATASGYGGCGTADSGKTIYLCFQWRDSNGVVGGVATSSVLTTDFIAPQPPTAATTTPGDSVLHLNCAAGTDDTQFKALAQSTDTRDTQPHWSSQVRGCSNLSVSGLTNHVTYDVSIYGLDDANNPSRDSSGNLAFASTTGTPIPTHDFWDQYHTDGGPEQGGCNTGGATAAGLAGALSILVALRRRKS